MEWNIISEKGLPERNGKYGIIFRYRNTKQVHAHAANFINGGWVNTLGDEEILAWCEFPPIPSQFII